MKKKIFEDGNHILSEMDNEDELLLKFTDDIIDSGGRVKGTVKNKGAVCGQIAGHLYKLLASYHLPVRLKSQKSERELVVKNADLFPFYVSLQNNQADDGTESPNIQFVLFKDDAEKVVDIKGLVSEGAASQDHAVEVRRMVLKMNVVLKSFFQRRNLQLLGFRAQFGILPNEKVALCSELTLDSCELKSASSRTKFTTTYMLSHLDNAAELYDEALSAILLSSENHQDE